MFRLRAPHPTQLRALLDRQAHSSLTYSEVGATRDHDLPTGYVHDRHHIDLGSGAFERAAAGLRAWQAHLGAGVDVYPEGAPLATGTDVIVVARAGPLRALAPCRVVYVIDEPDRCGFAYGTLAGHPERGEEAFIVERVAGEAATFSIIVFSRPAELAARVGGPVARRIQRRVTHAYLEALRDYATAAA